MTSYQELILNLRSVVMAAEQFGNPFNDDLIGEAIEALSDLERLEQRIHRSMAELMRIDDSQGASIIEALRNASKNDPALADFFAKNLNPQISAVGFAASADSGSIIQDGGKNSSLQDLRIDTHAWYHRAHRLLKVLSCIPSLRGIKCHQIFIVRNQLLEHPEGAASQVTHCSFGYDRQRGPIVKALRKGDQAGRHQDNGQYAASNSLRAALLKSFETAKQKFMGSK